MAHRLGKKGNALEPLVFLMAAVLITALSFYVILIIISMAYEKGHDEVTAEKLESGDTLFLLNYLRSREITDLIVSSYEDGDYGKLRERTSAIMDKTYGMPVCWKLYIEDKEVSNTQDCTWLEGTPYGDIRAKAYLPYGNTVLKIGFGEKA